MRKMKPNVKMTPAEEFAALSRVIQELILIIIRSDEKKERDRALAAAAQSENPPAVLAAKGRRKRKPASLLPAGGDEGISTADTPSRASGRARRKKPK